MLLLSVFSCSSPREILISGRVTPKGEIRAGGHFSGNISTMTAGALNDAKDAMTETSINSISSQNTVLYNEPLKNISRAVASYSLDPIGANTGFYFRYGLGRNFDLGYRRSSGVNIFSSMYQFMGSDSLKEQKSSVFGSIGLQYSSQEPTKILEKLYIDKISFLLNYNFNRKDIIVPIVFSKSFGENEKYGSISWGASYNFSMIEYGYNPVKIFSSALGSPASLKAFTEKINFSSYGLFCNIKGGYKKVFAIFSLSAYYQNITNVKLLDMQTTKLSGFTFVPALALQFQFSRSNKK